MTIDKEILRRCARQGFFQAQSLNRTIDPELNDYKIPEEYRMIGSVIDKETERHTEAFWLKLTQSIIREYLLAQWRPMETAPKDGRRILLFNSDAQTINICFFSYGFWEDEEGEIVNDGSHWMALPEPPEGG